jgi:hypothetical protein
LEFKNIVLEVKLSNKFKNGNEKFLVRAAAVTDTGSGAPNATIPSGLGDFSYFLSQLIIQLFALVKIFFKCSLS